MVRKSSGESATPEADGRRLGGGAIASLIGVGLLLIFMIQNTESVQLDFLVWSFTWPLWLLTMALRTMALRGSRGVGVVRTGRDAPSSSSQGAPPRPSELNRPKTSHRGTIPNPHSAQDPVPRTSAFTAAYCANGPDRRA
jgi:uncharacterized integral membrane protein